jgi:hypothetical protein
VQKALGAPSSRQAGKPFSEVAAEEAECSAGEAVSSRSVLTHALKGRVTKKFGSPNRMARYPNANGAAVERTFDIPGIDQSRKTPP